MTPADKIAIAALVISILTAISGAFWGKWQSEKMARLEKTLELDNDKASVLHQQRMSIIIEMHSNIYKFLSAAQHYCSPIVWDGENGRKERLKTLSKATEEFHQYFQDNRLYFPNELAAQIKDLFEQVFMSTAGLSAYESMLDQGIDRKKVDEERRKVWDLIQEEIPPILEAIRSEFQLMMGVTRQ